MKMDQEGNILVKRFSKTNVYVKGWQGDPDRIESTVRNSSITTSVSDQIIKLSGLLEFEKSLKLFDMKKFKANVGRELRCAYPDRRKLESQCIACIGFVKDAPDVLDLPSWIIIINIVAMDMLKSKFPPGKPLGSSQEKKQFFLLMCTLPICELLLPF